MSLGRRVLLVEEGGRGGVADYSAELAAALARAGWTVAVATARDHRHPPAPGVTAHRLFPYVRGGSALGRWVRERGLSKAVNGATHLAATAPLLALARASDVVHVQGGEFPPLGALQALAVRGLRRPLVWTPHNTFERGSSDHARANATIRRCAARVIVHSEFDRGMLPAAERATTAVIPHGEYGGLARRGGPLADPAAARAEFGIPAEATVALLFGQLRPDKGVRDLLQAALALPRLHVVLAGQELGALAESADLCADERLRGRLLVREGFVPADEANRLFAAADVAVLPYRRASASGVLLLAYGNARPVVAYPVGGLPEYVEQGVTGWLSAAAEPAALTATLRELLELPQARLRQLGEAARRRAEERYGWDAIARQTGALYAELLRS